MRITKITKKKIDMIIMIIIILISSNTSVMAATDEQRSDTLRKSEWSNQEATCSTGSGPILSTDLSSSGSRIGYVSGLQGPYILEQFAIHSLKALALAKGVPESDVLTEDHVVALVAFSIGEGGDIANRNIFNPLNHGKIKDDNGVLTGDGTSGFVKYSSFDDGVDSNARVLNGTYQQRIAAALTNKDTTAAQVMHAVSYWKDYATTKGFVNDKFWAEASGPGTAGDSTTDGYYQTRVQLVNQVKSNWAGTAGLVVGTEAEEQQAGLKIPSKLTYNPSGSTAVEADSDISGVDVAGGNSSGFCSPETTIKAGAPEIDMSKKDTFTGETINPKGVVLHWTGSDKGDSVDEFIKGIQSNTACDGGCSVQFYVDGTGKIYQLVDPINTLTAHAAGANSCCIGIEIAGRGESDLIDNASQKQSVVNLTAYLVSTFNMEVEADTLSLSGILSHHITPDGVGRNQDVGDIYHQQIVAAVKASQSSSPVDLDEVKKGWLTASGIPEADWANVDAIVRPESGWDPTAQNPSSSAYGLAQFLNATWGAVGCQKTSDPVIQLQCADKYVKSRYQTWAGAVEYRKQNGTY